MTNEPNIKGCLTRAIEALESVEDLRDAMQIVGVWPKGLSISNVGQSIADLKAFVAALPDRSPLIYHECYEDGDFKYAEIDRTVKLTMEAISDE